MKKVFWLLALAFVGLLAIGYVESRKWGPGLGSHDARAKFDAEEAGYHDEFEMPYRKATGYARDLCAATRDAAQFRSSGPQDQFRSALETGNEKFRELQQLVPTTLHRLEGTAPPASMKAVHHRFVALLRNVQRASEPDGIAEDCRGFYQASQEFLQEIERRPAQPPLPSSVNIVYKPHPLLPGIPLVGESSFEIGVATPVGDFSMSSHQAGVSRLVLREKQKSRFFKLDREFDVLLYSPGNVRINANMKEKTLTIEVP